MKAFRVEVREVQRMNPFFFGADVLKLQNPDVHRELQKATKTTVDRKQRKEPEPTQNRRT
jgi:hypothetical protein